MTDTTPPAGSHPVLRTTEAQLVVADVAAACAFYVDRLGFAVGFVHGEPPTYAQVVRDGARLNLRAIGERVFVGDIREREQVLAASLTLATRREIDRLFADFCAAGVGFHAALSVAPWGAATFVVRDPDGNLILFAGPGS